MEKEKISVREKISGREAIALTAIFIIGTTNITEGNKIAKQDTWISLLISMAAAVPLFFIYSRISTIYPNKSLYEIIFIVFGKWIGTIVCILFSLFALQLSAFVIRNFTEFVQMTSLNKTPQLLIAFILTFISLWIIKSGIGILGRCSVFFLIVISAVSVAIFFLLFKDFNFRNLLPIGGSGTNAIASNSISFLAFPFSETFFLLSFFDSLKKENDGSKNINRYKTYYWGLIIGGANILISILTNLFALGKKSYTDLYFSSYVSASLINIGNFFQRVEILSAGTLLICALVKLTIALFASCKGFAHALRIEDHKTIAVPIGLMAIILSAISFEGINEILTWLSSYPYMAIPALIGIPIIMWIISEVKHYVRKKRFPDSK